MVQAIKQAAPMSKKALKAAAKACLEGKKGGGETATLETLRRRLHWGKPCVVPQYSCPAQE